MKIRWNKKIIARQDIKDEVSSILWQIHEQGNIPLPDFIEIILDIASAWVHHFWKEESRG